MPCGHFCMCIECAASVNECPVCRGSVKQFYILCWNNPAGARSVRHGVPEASKSCPKMDPKSANAESFYIVCR